MSVLISGVLQTMVSIGEGDQVALHLSTYGFMTKHLVAITKKTDLALRLAADPGMYSSTVCLLLPLSLPLSLRIG